MTAQLTARKPAVKDELWFSYFVRGKNEKPSRVGVARVLDISATGLCMEIVPCDSDLFVDLCGKLPVVNRDIELQIYCRSHPRNIFVQGIVQWFKQKKEFDASSDEFGLCAGVVFSGSDSCLDNDIADLMECIGVEMVTCSTCGTLISEDAVLCHKCASKLVRRRALLREAIFSALAPDADSTA